MFLCVTNMPVQYLIGTNFHLPNALAALDRLENQFVGVSVSQSLSLVTRNE